MFKSNLPLRFLKFLLRNGGIKSKIDISGFLKSNFPEEADNDERTKMRNFLEILDKDEYIKTENIISLKLGKQNGNTTDLKSKEITA